MRLVSLTALSLLISGGCFTPDSTPKPKPTAQKTSKETKPVEEKTQPVEEKTQPSAQQVALPPSASASKAHEADQISRTHHHPTEGTKSSTGALPGDGTTQEAVVLDINAQYAALKVVSFPVDLEFASLQDCKYPGVETNPGATVSLGLFDLKKGHIEEWKVYPTAWIHDACPPHEKSKAVLEAAKAAFKKAGLDISKKPQGKTFSEKGLTIHGVTYTVKFQNGTSPKDPIFAEVFGTDEEFAMMTAVTQTELWANGEVQYQLRDTYETQMAGSLKIKPQKAYEVEGGVVVLLEHQFFSGRGVGNSYSFSPVLR